MGGIPGWCLWEGEPGIGTPVEVQQDAPARFSLGRRTLTTLGWFGVWLLLGVHGGGKQLPGDPKRVQGGSARTPECPSVPMYQQFAYVAMFLAIIGAVVWVPLFLGVLLRPKYPFREKNAIYECGEPTIGTSWVRYNIRFYTTALLFLLFDVEVVLLIPVALWLRPAAAQATSGGSLALPWLVFLEIGFFVAVLAIGLAYAWRTGGLDWVRGDEEEQPEAEAKPREVVLAEPIPVGKG